MTAGLLALLALLAYGPALHGDFLFDDVPSIREGAAIHRGDVWAAAFGDQATPISSRPVVCLSFVLNHAVGGLRPWGYHAVNLCLHLLNALMLLAVVRRMLLAPNLKGSWGARRATLVAAATASLWALHPLGCDAVAYLTQRTTLLMSSFLLLAWLMVLRAPFSPRRRTHQTVAVVAVALAMASKEEAIAAPILIVLLERAFLFDSWSAMRRRWPFYGGLAATWVVLLSCVLLGPANETVGFDVQPRTSAVEWLMTQAPVVAHYLGLSLWPQPLRGAYDWPIVRQPGPAVLPGLLVLGLLVVTVLLWWRRPWWGWLGAMFFLLLAPTSSILPIVTEVAAERRVYLPMLAVVVPVVIGCAAGLSRWGARPVWGWSAWLLVAVAALTATRERAAVYGDPAAFWRDCFQKNELRSGTLAAASILGNYATLVSLPAGRLEEAHDLFQRAVSGETPTLVDRVNHAGILAQMGRFDEAARLFRGVLADRPDFVPALSNLATCLLDGHLKSLQGQQMRPLDPGLAEAERLMRRAMELAPGQWQLPNLLGQALFFQDRPQEAGAAFRRAIAADPAQARGYLNLARAAMRLGRPQDAEAALRRLLAVQPGHAEAQAMLQAIGRGR